MTIEEKIDCLGYEDEDIIIFKDPDYEQVFIGVTNDKRAAYSYQRMVECLMVEDKMSYDDAVDFISYNTERALPYIGERAPVIVYDLPFDDEYEHEEEEGPF